MQNNPFAKEMHLKAVVVRNLQTVKAWANVERHY